MVARKKIRGAISMHTPRTLWRVRSSQSTRNQHAINAISTQSARTQMASPRQQLDGLAVAEAPVGKRAPC